MANRDYHEMIPIWFFIGCVLAFYGILIMGAGIYQLFFPPEHKIALYNLHPNIWWGAIMIIFGVIYIVKFKPKKD
ncbi:MAG: hypothetical protein ACP5T0_09320 [Verrucomicrobiia bacterium]